MLDIRSRIGICTTREVENATLALSHAVTELENVVSCAHRIAEVMGSLKDLLAPQAKQEVAPQPTCSSCEWDYDRATSFKIQGTGVSRGGIRPAVFRKSASIHGRRNEGSANSFETYHFRLKLISHGLLDPESGRRIYKFFTTGVKQRPKPPKRNANALYP